MFVTIPTFTIFNKIKVVVRLCGQLAGHECAAARPSYPAAQQRRPTHCTDCLWESVSGAVRTKQKTVESR